MIDKFDGEYAFLSNFYDATIQYDGTFYKNNEAAFQAQKTLDDKEKAKFAELNPAQAKRLGRKIKLRSDWEIIKGQIMYEVCFAKFTQNEDLKKKLLSTDGHHLIEGNYWHDNTWGNCTCEKCVSIQGQNRLGVILMKIREELKNE